MSTGSTEKDDDDEFCMLPPRTGGGSTALTGMSSAHATGTTVQKLQNSDHSDREVCVCMCPSGVRICAFRVCVCVNVCALGVCVCVCCDLYCAFRSIVWCVHVWVFMCVGMYAVEGLRLHTMLSA